MAVLSVQHLAFGYSAGRVVLDDLSLTLGPGVTALLGPNGAGKSTLMGLLAGAMPPRSGEVAFQSDDMARPVDSRRRDYLRMVTWVPQGFRPVGGLSVSEHVTYAGWLKGMKRREARSQTPVALAQAGLEDLGDRPARSLSGGQTQRLGLAGAFVHDASVLLLDEPTVGLDLVERERFARELANQAPGRITVMSTHDTAGIDRFVDHVVVLLEGRAVFTGSLEALLERGGVDGDAQERLVRAYAGLTGGEL